jgi:predicted nucleic acid-binding protein
MAGNFIDTNILVYLASNDAAKAARAEAIIAAGGAISVQVINELANLLRRKLQFSWDETHGFLDAIRGLLAVHPLTLKTHDAGLRFAEKYSFSIYDALIVASALEQGCDTLWSEDMQDGMTLEEGLSIQNPFRK